MNFRFSGSTLVRGAFLALVLWIGFWLGVLAVAPPQIRLVWAGLCLFPLAILAPFLFRGSKSAYGWAGFLSLGYFALGIAVTLGSRNLNGAVVIFLSILLFFGATAALKDLQRINASQ
ncbi:MAG TPA: DUF2069 domain-containing protein [Gammaproteobacteria bacterium]|jgi:uncharacterized membrane protein